MVKLSNICKTAAFLLSIYLLICYGGLFREGILSGFTLCITVVIPSLFTFIVFSTFIVNTNFFVILKDFIPIIFTRLFKMNKAEFLSFLISLIGGYPSGAKLLGEMSQNDEITKKRAAELMPFFISAGPAFIITGIGLSFYNSSVVGFILFSAHTISSLALPIIFLKSGDNDRRYTKKSGSIADKFVFSISSCSSAVIAMTGFIIFFGAILNTALHLLNLDDISYSILSLLLEITSGCHFVYQNLPINAALLSITAGLSFSSISILMQAKFLCSNSYINIKKLLFIRIAHAILSTSICYFLLQITAIPAEVFSNIDSTSSMPTSLSVASSLMFILLMLTTILKVEKNTGKNRRNLIK